MKISLFPKPAEGEGRGTAMEAEEAGGGNDDDKDDDVCEVFTRDGSGMGRSNKSTGMEEPEPAAIEARVLPAGTAGVAGEREVAVAVVGGGLMGDIAVPDADWLTGTFAAVVDAELAFGEAGCRVVADDLPDAAALRAA